MKKLYSLLLTAALCLLSQVTVAQIPAINSNHNIDRTNNNVTWYTIKNAVTGEYLRYEGFKFSMTTSPQTVDGVYALDTCNMFYITGTASAAKIHNYAAGTARICAAPNKWDESGTLFQIKATDGGVFISQTGELAASDAFHYNETNGKVDLYLGSDPNSVWIFEPITDFAPIMGLNKLVDDAYSATNSADIWGNGFWAGLGKWLDTALDKGTLKDRENDVSFGWGLIFIERSIIYRDHSTLSATLEDYAEAKAILEKYSKGYTTVFKFAEIYNEDYSTDENKRWMSTNSTALTVNDIQTTHTNVWYLQNVEGETFYIYNEAANMYIGVAHEDGATVKMTADINQAGVYKIITTKEDVELDSKEENVVSAIIKFESMDTPGLYICMPNATSKSVAYASKEGDTYPTGARWKVLPVADVEIKDDFYALAANMAWQYPYYLQENEGLVQDACIYYTSNAPAADGTTTCELVDGSYTTSFTTTEGSISEPHYLQAYLANGAVTQFYFYIKANLQRTNGRPIDISVYGSNDGSSFTKITDVKTKMTDEMFYFSDLIECPAYQHLRFEVNSVNIGEKAFSISEFYVLPYDTDVQSCVDAIKGFYGTALYAEEIKKYATRLVALEAQYYYDNNTVENGKVAADPAVGQYRKKEYDLLFDALEDFKALEETGTDDEKYNQGLMLAETLYAFKDSKCSPMFIISSAWEDGFSAEWAVSYNEQNSSFAAAYANYWDIRQWFVNYSLHATVMEAMNAVEIKSAIDKTLLMNAQHSSAEIIANWETIYESAKEGYAVRVYNAPDYLTVNEYQELGTTNKKPTTSSNQNAAWYFTYVGKSSQIYDLDATNDDHITFINALAEFGLIFQTAYSYNDNYDESGTLMGKYHYDNKGENELTKSGFDTLFGEAAVIFEKGPAKMAEEFFGDTPGYTATQLSTLVADLKAHFVNFRLNTPPAGYYYRIRGNYSLNYLQSVITDGKIEMGTLTDGSGTIDNNVAATSVFYAVEGNADGATNMLSFNTGRYFEHNGTAFQYANYPCIVYSPENRYPHENDTYYSQNIFVHQSVTGTEGYFAMAFNDTHYLCDNVTNATAPNTGYQDNKKCDWSIELVTELPLEISSAKVTSLCVPVELEIPEGITAYILTGKEIADGNHLRVTDYEAFADGTPVYNLVPIECGIIPAGLPVIIKGDEGVHYFPINYDADDEKDSDGTAKSDELKEEIASLRNNNWLDGTHDSRFISEADGYTHQILSIKDGEVGMYKVKMNTAAERGITYISTDKPLFINQAHRAWLCYPTEVAVSSTGYSFAIGGTGRDATGVGELKSENGKVKGTYDMQGRKLTEITEPGLYIIDGKKVHIK